MHLQITDILTFRVRISIVYQISSSDLFFWYRSCSDIIIKLKHITRYSLTDNFVLTIFEPVFSSSRTYSDLRLNRNVVWFSQSEKHQWLKFLSSQTLRISSFISQTTSDFRNHAIWISKNIISNILALLQFVWLR